MAFITGAQLKPSRIGYENLFITAGVTVTVSDEVTGFEKENAYDWKQYDWWKQSALGTSWLRASFSSAESADYMAIFGHNLHSVGGSVKPQYSTDAGSTWSDATTVTAPSEGNTLYIGFDAVLAADWRCLVVTTTGQSVIAGIMIGESMVFNRGLRSGFKPPTMSPIKKFKEAKSEFGVNLGGTVKSVGIKGSIRLKDVDPDWVRSDWVPLINHLDVMKPCVFSWDYAGHPDEAALIWIKRTIPAPKYSSTLYMDVSLNFEGKE